jgi:hypothetical protein
MKIESTVPRVVHAWTNKQQRIKVMLAPGLPDGFFSNQFGQILERLRWENVDIFHGHLEYFRNIWDILLPFDTFFAFGTFFPVLVSCAKKNLATLVGAHNEGGDLGCEKQTLEFGARCQSWPKTKSTSNETLASFCGNWAALPPGVDGRIITFCEFFCDFSPIFGEKIGVFLKKQC